MSIDKTYNIYGAFKPTTKRNADLNSADFYPTPKWATYALMENESFVGDIWECACGDGNMSKVLNNYVSNVYSSDLYDRGFGDCGIDFLTSQKEFSNIITNPPYNSAEGFVKRGNLLAKRKFALLLRLAFLEGANRSNTIYSDMPPSRVWVFSERITFYQSGVKKKGSGTTAYAWFIWDKDHFGETQLKWIKPGFKKRFSNL